MSHVGTCGSTTGKIAHSGSQNMAQAWERLLCSMAQAEQANRQGHRAHGRRSHCL